MNIFEEIARERCGQDAKWGIQNHAPIEWLVILSEEVGEAAHAVLSRDRSLYRDELLHVAAVAVAAIEGLDAGRIGVERRQE